MANHYDISFPSNGQHFRLAEEKKDDGVFSLFLERGVCMMACRLHVSILVFFFLAGGKGAVACCFAYYRTPASIICKLVYRLNYCEWTYTAGERWKTKRSAISEYLLFTRNFTLYICFYFFLSFLFEQRNPKDGEGGGGWREGTLVRKKSLWIIWSVYMKPGLISLAEHTHTHRKFVDRKN